MNQNPCVPKFAMPMNFLNALRFHIIGIVANRIQREQMENQGSYIDYSSHSHFTLIVFVESNDLHGYHFTI